MDTNLGVIELTQKQISNLETLKTENIKGFSYWHDKKEVVVVSENELSEEQIAELKLAISALPDEYTQDELVRRFNADIAIGREAQVFTGEELIRLMPYSYTLNELIRFKNFWGGVTNDVPYAGLKQVLEGLVAGSMILQSDSDKLAGILAEQWIDLNA